MAQRKPPPLGVASAKRLKDFSGGWVTSVSPELLRDTEARQADNVSFAQRGTLSPRAGRTQRFAAVIDTEPVQGLGMLKKDDGTTRLLIALSGAVYYDTPSDINQYTSQADFEAPGTLTWQALANSGLTWNDLI